MKQEVIAGIILCVIGLGLLLTPVRALWTVTEKWKNQGGGKPTKAYTVIMRALDIVFAAVGGILAATHL